MSSSSVPCMRSICFGIQSLLGYLGKSRPILLVRQGEQHALNRHSSIRLTNVLPLVPSQRTGGRVQTPSATKTGLMIYSTPVAGAVGKWEARFAFHFSMALGCNGSLADVCPVLDEVEGAFWEEQFGGSFPAECFPASGIEFPADTVELFLGEQGEIGRLGEVLSDEAIDVFADASFPGSMRMSEIDSDSSTFGECLMFAHLAALVKGHGEAHLSLKAFEDPGKGPRYRGGLAILQPHQDAKEGFAFDQHADLRQIPLANDEVPFPVAWNQSISHFGRSLVDQGHVRNGSTPAVFTACRSAGLVSTA